MSLSTPQSVTLDSVATDLHRIKDDGLKSEYRSNDETVVMTVSHQENKTRTRRMARLDVTKVATDPLSADSVEKSASVYLVIDEPLFGFTDADLTDQCAALTTWVTAQIAAILTSRH